MEDIEDETSNYESKLKEKYKIEDLDEDVGEAGELYYAETIEEELGDTGWTYERYYVTDLAKKTLSKPELNKLQKYVDQLNAVETEASELVKEEEAPAEEVPEKEMPSGIIGPGMISIPEGLNAKQKAAYLKSIGVMSEAKEVGNLDSATDEISDKLKDKLCK
jgi:hypothetical protein